MTDPARVPLSRRTRLSVVALGLLVAVAVAFVLYGRVGGRGNADPALCPDSGALSQKLTPFFRGGIAAMRPVDPPRPLPSFAFTGPDGSTLLGAFRGKVVLFNLWATWCVPCREEMPALDRLQAQKGGPDFTVLAPDATVMAFSPLASTVMKAAPVGASTAAMA